MAGEIASSALCVALVARWPSAAGGPADAGRTSDGVASGFRWASRYCVHSVALLERLRRVAASLLALRGDERCGSEILYEVRAADGTLSQEEGLVRRQAGLGGGGCGPGEGCRLSTSNTPVEPATGGVARQRHAASYPMSVTRDFPSESRKDARGYASVLLAARPVVGCARTSDGPRGAVT